VALADPYTSLVRSEATYPGRRICLMIDASNSMSSPFKAEHLAQRSEAESNAFVTTVAAAERFVQMRMSGPYRDLLALVEFGADAYVVTPFTNDYDNLLVSLSLIGEPHEFATFPDQRTLIANAIEESVELFKTFKFLDASGNLLLIFSDGEDTNAVVNGRPLDEIIRGAIEVFPCISCAPTTTRPKAIRPCLTSSGAKRCARPAASSSRRATSARCSLPSTRSITWLPARSR
jgi:hypothetical protein